jgi:sirohydrochlorin ferrochelatase
MSSNLWVKQGIYDPTKRFLFTNITSEPFTFTWGKSPITVKAGEVIELPHHLAVLATTALVDQIMNKEIKEEEDKMKLETKNPYYRSPRGSSLGIPAAREPYEKKICRELERSESKVTESQMGVIRTELAETLKRDLAGENSPKITKMSDLGVDAKAFEEINIPSSK